MESSSTLSYMLCNAELPCNPVSLGFPGYNQPHHPLGLSGYNQQHHHSLQSSLRFSPTILPGFEPTYLWQEVHAALCPQEKPGCMLPSSAFNFGLVADDCGGAASVAGYDITSHVFTNEKLDPKPLSPYRHTQGGSSTARMMASLIRNGGVTDIPHLDTVRILNNKWGFLTNDAGLTVDESKGGLAIKSGVHVPTRSMEPEFTNSAYLTKQSSFSSSSELAQVAAYHPARGDEGWNLHGLAKAASRANLMEMPNGLDTPVCLPRNSPSGCHVSQTNLGRMSNGLDTLLHLPCNALNGCHVRHQGTIQQAVTMSPFVHGVSQIKEEHTSFGTYPSFSPVPINFDTGEGTQKVCVSSIHESDESFGLEASSNCEQNGGCGSTIQRVTKGKNKRIKDRPKGSTARVSKDDEVKKGKRCKSGECASEENQKVEQSTSTNSNDSTPTSGNESSKPPEPSKPDYIHVRARRGQATDSHSLAERVRREKISERMKVLQELVPGCIKVTGKALMLDEIINYVQSLQRQVEFLSMKLAALNPNLEFHMDDFSSGIQMIQPQVPHHETMMISTENTTSYSPFLHHQQHAHTPQQMGTLCPPVNVQSQGGLDMAVSTSVESMDAISQVTRAWDEELQHVGQLFSYQGRPAPFPLSSLQDEPCFNGQLKVEFGPSDINFVKNNENSF